MNRYRRQQCDLVVHTDFHSPADRFTSLRRDELGEIVRRSNVGRHNVTGEVRS